MCELMLKNVAKRDSMVTDKGEKNLYVYAYEIHGEILYYLDDMLLVNLNKTKFSRIQLRKTMGNLLQYFLENSSKSFISDDELMSEVWEKHDLRASSHRLWQVVKDLNLTLKEVGLTEDVFVRTKRQRRFTVRRDCIEALYKTKDI